MKGLNLKYSHSCKLIRNIAVRKILKSNKFFSYKNYLTTISTDEPSFVKRSWKNFSKNPFRIYFTDECVFLLNENVNKYICRYWHNEIPDNVFRLLHSVGENNVALNQTVINKVSCLLENTIEPLISQVLEDQIEP